MQRLIEILKRFNYVLVFIILEAIALTLIYRNNYYQQTQIINIGNRIAGETYNMSASVRDYFGLRHENELLHAENAALRAHITTPPTNRYITISPQRLSRTRGTAPATM